MQGSVHCDSAVERMSRREMCGHLEGKGKGEGVELNFVSCYDLSMNTKLSVSLFVVIAENDGSLASGIVGLDQIRSQASYHSLQLGSASRRISS